MGNETATFWAGIKKFEDILAINPDAYSFAPLADIYRKLGLLDESIAIARKGVARHPAFAAGQMALASSCLEKGLTDEAKVALEAVVRITPENLEAQRLLAGIHRIGGNVQAAEECLAIIASLDPEISTEPAALVEVPAAAEVVPAAAEFPLATEEPDTEEILDADILDLTDDLIEEESFTAEPFNPFAAAPERPSLQADVTVKTEAITNEPAQEKGVFEEAVAGDQEEMSAPPVMTATIAELYIKQGMTDRGVEVYRELLRDEPFNTTYRKRLDELTAGAAEADEVLVPEPVQGFAMTAEADQMPTASSSDVTGVLEGWLQNIGRMRGCRTESR